MWCTRCAAYTTRRPRTLRFPCRGKPTSAAARNILARLRQGMLPTTAGYLDRASIGRADDEPYGQLPMIPTEERAVEQPHDNDENEGVLCAPCGPAPLQRGRHGQSVAGADSDAKRASDAFLSSRYRALDSRRSSAHMQQTGALDVVDPPKAAPEPPQSGGQRKRIIGKQRVLDHNEAAEQEAAARRQRLCAPSPEAPWTQRMMLGATAVAAACRICGAQCRGKCAGCFSTLCISCARKRSHCVSETIVLAATATEAVHPHHRRHHLIMPRPAVPTVEHSRGEPSHRPNCPGQDAAAAAACSFNAVSIGDVNRPAADDSATVLAPAGCSVSTVFQVPAAAASAAAAATTDDG